MKIRLIGIPSFDSELLWFEQLIEFIQLYPHCYLYVLENASFHSATTLILQQLFSEKQMLRGNICCALLDTQEGKKHFIDINDKINRYLFHDETKFTLSKLNEPVACVLAGQFALLLDEKYQKDFKLLVKEMVDKISSLDANFENIIVLDLIYFNAVKKELEEKGHSIYCFAENLHVDEEKK